MKSWDVRLKEWFFHAWARVVLSLLFLGLAGISLYVGFGSDPDGLVVEIVKQADGQHIQKWRRVPKPVTFASLVPTQTPGAIATPGAKATAQPIVTPESTVVVDAYFESQSLEGKYDLAVKAVNGGELLKARAYLEKYIELDPNRGMAFYLLGYVQRRQDKASATAIVSFRKFLEMESSRSSKYRFSAASELVYLFARRKEHGRAEAAITLRDILFNQREAAYAYDKETGDRVREAWEFAVEGRGGKYAQWARKLRAMPKLEYLSPIASQGDPDLK